MVNINMILNRIRKLERNQGKRAREVRSNIRKIEKKISQERLMSDIMGMRFKRQGPGWVKLKPKTIKRKGHARILFDSGKLRRDAKRVVRKSFKVSGTVWHTLLSRLTTPYGKYHQKGMGFNPKRPFLKDPSQKELKLVIRRFKVLYVQLIRKGSI